MSSSVKLLKISCTEKGFQNNGLTSIFVRLARNERNGALILIGRERHLASFCQNPPENQFEFHLSLAVPTVILNLSLFSKILLHFQNPADNEEIQSFLFEVKGTRRYFLEQPLPVKIQPKPLAKRPHFDLEGSPFSTLT